MVRAGDSLPFSGDRTVLDQSALAKVVTMNTTLLKQLPLDDVLAVHPLLNAQAFQYGKARKVKPIKVRPINTILDTSEQSQSIWEKMLLATLEGAQSLKRDAMICWGVNNDVWQQTAKKLHDKYAPTEIDADGWVTFVPKPGDDAIMNAFQVIEDTPFTRCGPAGGFAIINPWWGDERLIPVGIFEVAGIDPAACGLKPGEMVKAYLHFGVSGDWVLQNQKDSTDTYRIAKGFFDATYEV
jgi:hypothetical protein